MLLKFVDNLSISLIGWGIRSFWLKNLSILQLHKLMLSIFYSTWLKRKVIILLFILQVCSMDKVLRIAIYESYHVGLCQRKFNGF